MANAKSAKKNAAAAGDDDLLGGAPTGSGGGGDDLLGGTPAKKAPAKKAAGKDAAPAKKAPAKKAPAKDAVVRSERGAGKFYFDPEEKAALAKKIAASKKPISTKELAEKFEVETWKVRRAINEVLVPDGKGTVEKEGNALVYTPA